MAKKPRLRLVAAAPREKKSHGGNRTWQPTPLERRTVERCMAIGFTMEQAAQVLGKSAKSLQRHCQKEMDTGYAKVGAKIGGQLIRKALKGDTAAMIFFAKCRLGWNEKQILEHQGAGGGPIQYDAVTASAEAFTRHIMQLADRHAAAMKAPPLLEATARPAPEQIN